MPATHEQQLGADLRLHRSPGPLNRQRLESIARDLLGADQSLLAPLSHLTGLPAFAALDPFSESIAIRQLGRDALLRELEDIYQPRVLQRLRQVLDGYLALEPTTTSQSTHTHAIAADSLLERAFKLLEEGGHSQEVIDLSTQALELEVNEDDINCLAHLARGLAKTASDDTQGASADFNRAFSLRPEAAETLYVRGRIKNSQGDTKGSISDCDQALAINPEFAEAYWARGSAKLALGVCRKTVP